MFNPENLRLTEDRVLLETDPAESMSAGGIILPNGTVKNFHATVKKVGPGLSLKNGQRGEMSVAPGDRVVFQKHAGNQLKYVGDNLLIVAERDILALVGENSDPEYGKPGWLESFDKVKTVILKEDYASGEQI